MERGKNINIRSKTKEGGTEKKRERRRSISEVIGFGIFSVECVNRAATRWPYRVPPRERW